MINVVLMNMTCRIIPNPNTRTLSCGSDYELIVVMKVSPSIFLLLIQDTDPHSKTICINNP